jgi:hypothetical protein
MIRFFKKKNMSKIPVDNGSSLNKLITQRIIVLTNITMIETSVYTPIETSVLAVYP